MEDEGKTREQLIEELKEMRLRLAAFEESSSHDSKLEEALRKSEERFRTVFENAPYGISVHSLRDGLYVAVNSAFEKNTGYSASDVLGKNALELGLLVHPEDYQRLADVRVQNGRIYNEPLDVRTRNGEIRHILFSTTSVDLHGEPSHITMTADITEERRAVEALRLSERKFADIFNLSPDYMGISHVSDGRLIDVNRSFEEGTGWSREEAIGRTALELNLWDEPQQRITATEKMNQESRLTNFDFVYRTKTGSKRHGWISMTPIRIQSNDCLCFAVRDISNRKRTEEALKESEAKFRALADSSSSGIFLIQGIKFIYFNPAFQSITGYTMGDLTDMNFWDVVHPDYRELVTERALGRLRGENQPSRYEIKFLTKDGQIKWCDYSASIIELDNKSTIIGSLFDITERKQAEEALRESEEKYRVLLDESTDPVFSFAPDGRYLYVNRAFAQGVGKDIDQIIGRKIWDVFPREEADKRFSALSYVFQSGEEKVIEIRVPRPDGDRFYITTITPIKEEQGKVISAICSSKDITARKQAEEALWESEAKYRFLTEKMTDIVWIADMDFRTTYVSPSIEAVLGFSPEERMAQDVTEQLTPASMTVALDVLAKELALEQQGQADPERKIIIESEYCHKDGSTRWIENIMSGIRDHQGVLTGLHGVSRDITRRKRVEEALRESQQQLLDIIDFLPDATLVIDKDKKIIAWNRTMEEMTGVSSKDMIGQGDYVCTIPFYGERRQHLLDLIDTDNEELASKYQYIRKKGNTLYAETFTPALYGGKGAYVFATGAPIFDVHGNRAGAIESIRDVTDYRQATEELRLSEQRKTILNRIVNIFLTAPDKEMYGEVLDVVIQVMKSKFGIFGYIGENGDLIIPSMTRDIWDNCHVFDKSVVFTSDTWGESLWGRAMREKKSFVSDGPFHTPEGHVHVDHFLTVPIIFGKETIGLISVANKEGGYTEEDKELLGGIVTHISPILNARLQRDVQERERRQAVEGLIENQRQLSDIIEFLPDATLVIDEEGKVIAWNRAVETMTGIKKEEMLGKGNYEYALPFYGNRRPILIDLALHPDREMERQYTAIQRVGDVLFGESFTPNLPPGDIHLSATASVLRNSKGEIIAAIECIRDNSERRRLEERLNRAEKMEGLGRLAGGVAHDLNNVLGVMVGYSELLAEKLPVKGPLKSYANNIYQSSLRGAAIIQDLLTLARRGVTVSEVVDINRVVFNYLRTPEFEKLKSYHQDVKIWTEIEEEILNIKGSPVHLGKAIMNLVSNAAEAIADQGEVTIRTENRYLDYPLHGYDDMQEGDYVVLTVSDTGSGISANDISKIFEPFYTKKVMGRSGTGLGLAVVWGTVKDHNGYIDVQSEEGKGSTFTLYFPATREDIAKVQEAISIEAYMGRSESILIVDDVKAQREVAVSMLGRLGYQAEAVSSGEKAIEYLSNRKADLVILDMIMDPGIDGMETYRRILEINPGQKAILVSGFSESDRVRNAQEMGAGAFVRKPYILEKIGLAIRKELDRK